MVHGRSVMGGYLAEHSDGATHAKKRGLDSETSSIVDYGGISRFTG